MPIATDSRGTAVDLVRSKPDLLIENAALRRQLLVLRYSVKRPLLTPADRTLLVLLTGQLRSWRHALFIIQPDTLLRRHRAGYRLFWRWRSQPKPGRPVLAESTIALIREMAAANPLWGTERIQGELLKLASPSPGAPFSATCKVLVGRAHVGRLGPPSGARRPGASVRATSPSAPTSAAGPYSPSLSPSMLRDAWSTWG